VTPDFKKSARELLANLASDGTTVQLAACASEACERLTAHLARLLGETGVRLLMKRSIAIASGRLPWLASASASEDLSVLRRAMEPQDAAAISDAFVAILTELVALLERLIGAPLVARLLDEVWPSVFTETEKDTP
jgi:hypothetical protein